MVWAGYQKDKPYDQRVGDLSHLISRERRRLEIEPSIMSMQ
jgi:hypothetical protein